MLFCFLKNIIEPLTAGQPHQNTHRQCEIFIELSGKWVTEI